MTYSAVTFIDGDPVPAIALTEMSEAVAGIAAGPRGLVARYGRTTSSSTTTTIVGVLRIDDIPIFLGRNYAIHASGLVLTSSVANDNVSASVRYTTDGSTPTTASPILPGAVSAEFVTSTTIVKTNPLQTTYAPAANQTLSLLLCVARGSGTGNAGIYADANFLCELVVEDIGADTGNVGTSI